MDILTRYVAGRQRTSCPVPGGLMEKVVGSCCCKKIINDIQQLKLLKKLHVSLLDTD